MPGLRGWRRRKGKPQFGWDLSKGLSGHWRKQQGLGGRNTFFISFCASSPRRPGLRTQHSAPMHKEKRGDRAFVIVQSLSRVPLFATPWAAARQASLSITISGSLLKRMSTELVRPSNHLILCHPLLLQPSVFLSIRVFSNESVLCIRWSKYCSFSFSNSPSSEYSGLISFRTDWLDLLTRYFLTRTLISSWGPHPRDLNYP